MTPIERYLGSLAIVNDLIDRASSYVDFTRYGNLKAYRDARDQIALGFKQAVNTRDAALVEKAARAMANLSIVLEKSFFDANGQPKPIVAEIATQFSQDVAQKAKAVAEGFENFFDWTKWILIGGAVVAGVVLLAIAAPRVKAAVA